MKPTNPSESSPLEKGVEEYESQIKCLCCGKPLTTRQQKEVMLCLPCFIKKYGDDEEE